MLLYSYPKHRICWQSGTENGQLLYQRLLLAPKVPYFLEALLPDQPFFFFLLLLVRQLYLSRFYRFVPTSMAPCHDDEQWHDGSKTAMDGHFKVKRS
jgi:hypothetical protein